jgi:hypothetical protein
VCLPVSGKKKPAGAKETRAGKIRGSKGMRGGERNGVARERNDGGGCDPVTCVPATSPGAVHTGWDAAVSSSQCLFV